MITSLEDLLQLHEGIRLYPYDDRTGKSLKEGDTLEGHLTIGVGRNLSTVGISQKELRLMLKSDIAHATKSANGYKWFDALSDSRKAVVVSMIFCMGSSGFKKFRRMRAAISVKDWEKAAVELLDSKFSRDVGNRALVLSHMLRTGEWPK